MLWFLALKFENFNTLLPKINSICCSPERIFGKVSIIPCKGNPNSKRIYFNSHKKGKWVQILKKWVRTYWQERIGLKKFNNRKSLMIGNLHTAKNVGVSFPLLMVSIALLLLYRYKCYPSRIQPKKLLCRIPTMHRRSIFKHSILSFESLTYEIIYRKLQLKTGHVSWK